MFRRLRHGQVPKVCRQYTYHILSASTVYAVTTLTRIRSSFVCAVWSPIQLHTSVSVLEDKARMLSIED